MFAGNWKILKTVPGRSAAEIVGIPSSAKINNGFIRTPTLLDHDGFIPLRVRRLAGKASPGQTRDVFRFQRGTERRRAVGAPGHAAIHQRDSVRVTHTDSRRMVRFDVGVRRSRPVIKYGPGVFGPAVEGDGHVVQRHVADPAFRDRKSTRLNSSHANISYA